MKRLARLRACLAAGVVCVVCAVAAVAQTDPPEARDLQEETQHIAVTVADMYGRTETRRIPVTIFRPRGDGPFPLVIMNHGRATTERRAQQGRQRFEALSRYLVAKGFVVLLPTRVGYAETYGDFDPESSGSCQSRRIEPMAQAASDQVLATHEFARTLPYVDAGRWLVMGQSVGGLAAVATVWRNPPGLLGGINFAGGVGGDPSNNPGRPCSPQDITRLWGNKAAQARVPMLWLYWQNDLYWGAEHPRRWHEAWVEGGAKAEFHSLPAAGADGHGGVNIDMDHWVPLAEAFLAGLGFTQPGVIERPPPTAFAALDDETKVPVPAAAREGAYRRFLAAALPRAFAIGPAGAFGFATGDWAIGRALGACQRRGPACRLYAADNDVVWAP
jgi:dienelactone hydrolase